PLASQYRCSQGPILAAHLTLADGWKLDGQYSFLATERGYDDNDASARWHDVHHHLNLETQWDLKSTTGAEWSVSAVYDFDQTVSDDTACYPVSHVASLQFALNF